MSRLAALTLCFAPLAVAADVPDDVLQTVTVSATASPYGGAPSQTLLPAGTSLLELPQSVTVLTGDYLRDRAPQSLGDALRGIPGVGVTQGEGHRDALVLRGVATTADLLLDGLRDDVQYLRDLYAVQQVEVLTGATGLLTGHSGGGGTVNRVSKQAGDRHREVLLQRSSHDGLRLTADWGDVIGSQAAGRVNLLWEDSGSWRDAVRLRRSGIAPVLRADITPELTLSGGVEHFSDARTVDRGVPSLGGRPLDTAPGRYFGDPDQSRSEVDANSVWSLLRWTSPSGLSVSNRNRWAYYDKSYANVYVRGVDVLKAEALISAYSQATTRTVLINRTDISWRSAAQELVAGLEWGLQHNNNQRLTGYFTDRSATTTIVPVPLAVGRTHETVSWRPGASDPDNRSALRYAAVFAQDTFTLNPLLKVQLGLRGERIGSQLHDKRSLATYARQETLWSPRAAVMLQPAADWTVYVSHAITNQTRAGEQLISLNSATAALAPERLATQEAGIKWAPDPTTLLTVAVYQLNRHNVAVTDPADATRQVLVDGQRVEGIELGGVADAGAWSAQASLSVQRAGLTADQGPALRSGARLAALPQVTASLWMRRQLTTAWSVALGARHRSSMLAATENLLMPGANVWLPSSTLMDAAVYWVQSPVWRVQLNLENVLDSRSFLSATNNYNILPAAPRSLRLGIALNL